MKRLVLTELDLSKRKTASQNEIRIPHLVQRLPFSSNGHDPFAKFWNEVWRVLKPGGTVVVIAPYYTSVQSVLYPRMVAELTFLQLNKEWRKVNNWASSLECDFTVEKVDYNISQEFQGRAHDAIQYHAAHSWNAVSDISVILRK